MKSRKFILGTHYIVSLLYMIGIVYGCEYNIMKVSIMGIE